MGFDGLLWQEMSNSVWFTDSKPICDRCGKTCEIAMELKSTKERYVFCFLKKDACFPLGMIGMLARVDDDFIYMRNITYKPLKPIGPKRKREPVGLSKRYEVMKQDGFQCVLCGNSGKDAQLEIDHITPVASGGTNLKNNLQTLCFKCNRGKRDKE